MIRYHNGTPAYVAPEAHGAQEALGADSYTWDTIEKENNRPVVYIANGTHGVRSPVTACIPSLTLRSQMYPVSGTINYTGISSVPIYDSTDKGHKWDPTLNFRQYFYSGDGGFTPTNGTAPEDRATAWLSFAGSWGDEQYNNTVVVRISRTSNARGC